MKSLLMVLLSATTLISCGVKTKSQKENNYVSALEAANRYQTAVMTKVHRGMVSLEQITDFERVTIGGTVSHLAFKLTNKKTILKKEGALVYTLVETTQENHTFRKIILEDVSDIRDTQEMLDSSLIRFEGEVMHFVRTDAFSEHIDENIELHGTEEVKGYIDLAAPCRGNVATRELEVHAYISGKRTNVPKASSTHERSCAGTLSNQELKAINLSSITFCDERTETGDCENYKDLSHLTADF